MEPSKHWDENFLIAMKKMMDDNKDYHRANLFYELEMNQLSKFPNWIWWYGVFAKYGNSPGRLFEWLLVWIL